ncbi:MAG: hypothetical protein QNJ82_08655 [Gammaproteobacteria bacterium]|nr:hypothetical protein [Gammaproteobacteria bacterium]
MPTSLPVDVLGELSVLSGEGAQFSVAAKGDRISVELPSLAAGRSVAKQAAGRLQRKAMLSKLHAGLRVADLTLEVNVAGTLVAHLAPDSETTLLARLLGISPMRVRPLGLLRAAISRPGTKHVA